MIRPGATAPQRREVKGSQRFYDVTRVRTVVQDEVSVRPRGMGLLSG